MKLKTDLLLERFLAKTDFDKSTNSANSKNALSLISRTRPGNQKATFIFAPWQSGEVMQKWIMKQVPKNHDVYSISPKSLLLKDPKQTTKQCKRVCQQALNKVLSLSKNYSNFNIVGLSVGTGIAAYVANRLDYSKLNSIDLVCPGAELSTSLWLSSRTKNLKKSYEEQGFKLSKIQKMWSELDLINNLGFAKRTPLRITYSKSDTVIVPEQTEKVIAKLKSTKTKILKIKKNRFFGHYLTMFWVWLNWRTIYHSGKIK